MPECAHERADPHRPRWLAEEGTQTTQADIGRASVPETQSFVHTLASVGKGTHFYPSQGEKTDKRRGGNLAKNLAAKCYHCSDRKEHGELRLGDFPPPRTIQISST